VGIAATLVYAVVSAVGNETFAIMQVLASIIGQVASADVSYFGHFLFSFRVKANHQAYLCRFLIIAAITFALNSAVTWLIADVLKLSPRIAIATVTVLIPIVNYVCNRFWVFMPGLVPANLAPAPMASRATEFDAGPG
jgi:putative flippase GtrA